MAAGRKPRWDPRLGRCAPKVPLKTHRSFDLAHEGEWLGGPLEAARFLTLVIERRGGQDLRREGQAGWRAIRT